MERTGDALTAHLPELLEAFGCADVVAPIDGTHLAAKQAS